MADQPTKSAAKKLKSCHQIYDEASGSARKWTMVNQDNPRTTSNASSSDREACRENQIRQKWCRKERRRRPAILIPATRPECEALELFVRSHFARPC